MKYPKCGQFRCIVTIKQGQQSPVFILKFEINLTGKSFTEAKETFIAENFDTLAPLSKELDISNYNRQP